MKTTSKTTFEVFRKCCFMKNKCCFMKNDVVLAMLRNKQHFSCCFSATFEFCKTTFRFFVDTKCCFSATFEIIKQHFCKTMWNVAFKTTRSCCFSATFNITEQHSIKTKMLFIKQHFVVAFGQHSRQQAQHIFVVLDQHLQFAAQHSCLHNQNETNATQPRIEPGTSST